MRKQETNQVIYISILVTFITLFFGTLIHDPLLHWVIIKLNGWQFASYSASVGIGSTDALVSSSQVANTSTFNYWLFFMFPSVFIFIFSFLVVVFRPNRLFIISGHILILLNFSSLLPTVPGSDAYKAIQFLVSRGWSEPSAYAIHYMILAVMFIIYGLYFYIGTENNPEDVKLRVQNIYR